MWTIEGSESFQQRCVRRLRAVLRAHRVPGSDFELLTDGVPRYTAHFQFHGQPHEIEVYETGPVMLAGKEGEQLFEAYLYRESEDAESMIRGFERRLNRYLAGGPWEEPDETGCLALLFSWFRGWRPRSGVEVPRS